jgi:hypothetical protein
MATETVNVGTRFPFINLAKAVGRAQQLFNADQRGREMGVAAAFAVWGYSEKSSGGFQTVAALKMYGLLKDADGGDARKVGLTDAALRYFRDEREDEKKKALAAFALAPKLIAALWNQWHGSPPADAVARSHLKADRGLNDQGARSLLAIYKENLAFAELKGDSMPPANDAEVEGEGGKGRERSDGDPPPPKPDSPPPRNQTEKLMAGERVVFTEEGKPSQYLKLIASGDLDQGLLEALEDFVKRQRKRLQAEVLKEFGVDQ